MTSVNWITHDRPDAILRSVMSFSDHIQLYGRHSDLLISQTGTIDLAPLFRGLPCSIRILNTKRREKWIDELKKVFQKECAEGDIIDFALRGHVGSASKVRTTGANRNSLLLTRVGEKFISVDDDVILDNFCFDFMEHVNEAYRLPSSAADPYTTYFLKDQACLSAILANCAVSAKTDFLRMHELFLGSTQSSANSIVALTASGILGDSGFSSPRIVLSLREEALLDLCEQEGAIECAISSRLLWRQPKISTLKQVSPLMTPCVGFSNDLPLPPFFPLGRNQDGAYPYALRACVPNAWIAHLNQSVHHSPLETRNYEGSLDSFHLRINDWLILIWAQLLQKKNPLSLDGNQPYQKAAEHFSEFAGVTTAEFNQNVQKLISEVLRQRIENIARQLEGLAKLKSPGLKTWNKLACAEIQLLKYAIGNPRHYVPIEALHLSEDLEVAGRIARSWIQEYSKLLKYWLEIREIARRHPPF